MAENEDDLPNKGMNDLIEFYTQKKNEQEALRKLLEALEVKSKKDKPTNEIDKN